MKTVNVLEVKSEDGSDAKYNIGCRAVAKALCTPTRNLRLHGDSVNIDSKFSSLAANSSKSRTRSPIDEIAKRYREDLVEFFTSREREREREREVFFFVKNWGKKLMVKERG